MPEMPIIDFDKCDHCGLCVSACKCGAIIMIAGRISIIETDDCLWCTTCEAICPREAISCVFDIVFDEEA